jgi:hypothetical protein
VDATAVLSPAVRDALLYDLLAAAVDQHRSPAVARAAAWAGDR